MNHESNKSIIPHIALAAIIVVLLLAILFWPAEPEPQKPKIKDAPILIEPETTEPLEQAPVAIKPKVEIESFVTDISETETKTEITPEPQPLDVSDGTIKTKLLALSDYEAFARLLINDALLERFVVMTTTLADEDIAANNRILTQPTKPFRTFRQAEKDWIDPASYKRYATYVEVFESLETSSLIALYLEYKPAIEDIFAEIGSPYDNFDDKLYNAISVLLDTPEVPVPIEIYTDSVMYKFVDDRLESLSAPQKQLLRTGPENMRRIKAKLREIQGSL